jgi:hypothetical protein
MRKSIAAAVAAATIAGGSFAVAAINPFGIASAQDSGTTPTAPAAPNGKFQSNEDPTHEANETPAQEAAEDAGQRPGGGHFRGGSNEDPAHEATESPEREAKEAAGGATKTAPTTPTPPPPTPGATTGASY